MENPRLSVVVASYKSRDTIMECLASLLDQSTGEPYEVMVVDSSGDGTDRLIGERFPGVRVLGFAERKMPGAARNAGVEEAGARIVAFVDADCVVPENWVAAVIRAHESPRLAIGGAIDNANPESYVSRAAHFSKFGRWLPGAPAGWMDEIAQTAMSYKGEVFERYGYLLEDCYSEETEYHWRLARDGLYLWFEPSIVVFHRNIEDPGVFLRHMFERGGHFGGVRVRCGGFSLRRRILYAAFSFLIPLKLFSDRARSVLKNGGYLRQFILSAPLVALGLVCWSLGECASYLRGYSPGRGTAR